MQSSTYRDIIEGKIAEWQSSLIKLGKQSGKAASDPRINTKMEQLKSKIETATVQLYELDEHENVGNTMETKGKILEIFSSVDKEFIGHDYKTPFML
jgi:hypothetical protein